MENYVNLILAVMVQEGLLDEKVASKYSEKLRVITIPSTFTGALQSVKTITDQIKNDNRQNLIKAELKKSVDTKK